MPLSFVFDKSLKHSGCRNLNPRVTSTSSLVTAMSCISKVDPVRAMNLGCIELQLGGNYFFYFSVDSC